MSLTVVVVTSFCFSNTVNTLSSYCKYIELLKKKQKTKNKKYVELLKKI